MLHRRDIEQVSGFESHKLLTVDEYLDFEEHSAVRHEYIAGLLVAQVGSTRRHNRIARNIFLLLCAAVRDSPCEAFYTDMRLRIDSNVVYYPDIIVICDPDDRDERFATSPCLVVEVLSPSTEGTDRREKLINYRRIPSLESYLIVHQHERRVIRHFRDGNGAWWQEELAGEGSMLLSCPQTELQLGQIYQDIVFDNE